MNTIVGCQRIKMALNFSSNTYIQKCMCKVFQSVVSILPIYFESVGLDVFSRYGFQESSFHAKPGNTRFWPNLDLEAKLEEFLRFQDRSGIPLAVAIVVDVPGIHLLRSKSEHGSSIIRKEMSFTTNRYMLESDDILSAFPAVYIRSTTHINSSSKTLDNRRNSGRKDNDDERAVEKNPRNSINSKIEVNSWPHTSWNNLVPMLKTINPLSSEAGLDDISLSRIDEDTSAYISPINSTMWFVAMKKMTDHNRWSRPNDDELPKKEQQFFRNFAASLRLTNVFNINLGTNNLKMDSILNELNNTLKGDKMSDCDDTSHLLESFNRIFALRSPSNKYSLQLGGEKPPVIPRLSKEQPKLSPKYPSHFAFFLGSHLMDSICDN